MLKELIDFKTFEIDWNSVEQISEFQRLTNGGYHNIWHNEGNSLNHTKLVVAECQKYLYEHPNDFTDYEKQVLITAALFHDIGKGPTNRLKEDGNYSAKYHSVEGEKITRYMLWDEDFYFRERVCSLVRYHMKPKHFRDKPIEDVKRNIIEMSLNCDLELLYHLNLFDVKGAESLYKEEEIANCETLKDVAMQLNCWDKPYEFFSKRNKFNFFYNKDEPTIFTGHYDFDVVILCGVVGAGKAQPDNTLIPTPNGKKRLDELFIGDYVFDEKGSPIKIINILPQGCVDNYEITLKSSRKTYSNGEHIWCVKSHSNNKITHRNITLNEMLKQPIKKGKGKEFTWRIPISDPINYSEISLPIDPYVMGHLLGDGCLTLRQLTLSTNNEENVLECAKLLNTIHKKTPGNNYSWSFFNNVEEYNPTGNGQKIKYLQTKKVLKDFPGLIGCKSGDKFIPDIYLCGSIDQRFSLLQGLLDSDGSIGKNGCVRYSTTSKKMKDNVIELCFGLGLLVSYVYVDKRKHTSITYNITISSSKELKQTKLFRTTYKIKRSKEIKTQELYKNNYDSIVSIKKVEDCTMRCITVDSPNGLYLTNDYIITHNSSRYETTYKPMGYELISRDIIRQELGMVGANGKFKGNKEQEEKVTEIEHQRIRELCEQRKSFVSDNIFLQKKYRDEFINIVKPYNPFITIEYHETSKENHIKRRMGQIDQNIIVKMMKNMEFPLKSEGYDIRYYRN